MQDDASLPLVSIVVPVHNSEPFLNELLDSVAGQTYDTLDVVLVDDGSSDSSLGICEKRQRSDSRFRVLKQPNSGAGVARNAGMAIAQGEYLICLDSDDLVASDMIEKLIKPMLAEPSIEITICGLDEYVDAAKEYRPAAWAVNQRTVPAFAPFSPKNIPLLFGQVVGYPWNKMIRRSLIDRWDLRWQEIEMHEDMAFSQTALALAENAYYVDEPLYHHRIRSSNGSLSSDENQDKRYECLFVALEKIKEDLKLADVWDVYERAFANYALAQCRWKYGRVSEAARNDVSSSLVNVWFDRLGLSGYPPDTFASSEDYGFMQSLIADNHLTSCSEHASRSNPASRQGSDDARQMCSGRRFSKRIEHAIQKLFYRDR